jgi:hypothetical protein
VHKVVVATVVVAVVGLLVGVGVPSAFADVDPAPGKTGAGITVRNSTVALGQDGDGSGGGRRCTYQKANVPGDPSSELVNPPPPPTPGAQGSWYFYDCTATGNMLATGVMWVPANQPAVAPAVLAQEAYKWLPAPPPGIQTSPAATFDQVANVPTWLWVEPATWGVRRATASVPNESATVTATPVMVTWTMGDGSQVVCRGPGTAYTGGDPARPSPDCGHTYQQSSAREPGLRYPVTATTTWRITWVATGVAAASGTFAPLQRTSTTALRVAEAQTVN